MLAALLLVMSADAGAVAVAVDPAMTEPNPKTMTQKQIREFNAKVPRSHPYYIRCVASGEVGSLVKKTYSCRTNHQWRVADDRANDDARDTTERMASKFWETSN